MKTPKVTPFKLIGLALSLFLLPPVSVTVFLAIRLLHRVGSGGVRQYLFQMTIATFPIILTMIVAFFLRRLPLRWAPVIAAAIGAAGGIALTVLLR